MIPCTGTIKASDINTELSRTPTSLFHLDGAGERGLAGKPSGLIKFSDFYCKSSSFNLTVGQDSFTASGLALYGFGIYQAAGYNYGYIDGNRPSAIFPAGYGGATIPFYPVICGTNYGNVSGRKVTFHCSSVPNDNYYVKPFGETMQITWEMPNGSKYTYVLTWTGGRGYEARENALVLQEALKDNLGKVVKVSIKKI